MDRPKSMYEERGNEGSMEKLFVDAYATKSVFFVIVVLNCKDYLCAKFQQNRSQILMFKNKKVEKFFITDFDKIWHIYLCAKSHN